MSFTLVDALIIIACITMLVRSFRVGLLRQVASLAGFYCGLVIGSLIAPHVISSFQTPSLRALIVLIITLGLAVLLSSIFESVSVSIRSAIKVKPLLQFESVLGAVFGVIAVLVSSWLLAAMLQRFPSPEANQAIQRSAIITQLNATLPPAPGIISRIAQLISPNGFPNVFVESEPTLSQAGPPSNATVQQAADRTKASVLKIQGVGCGGVVSGSGFIVGTNLVATNAHVVAGITRPTVEYHGRSYTAAVVWFNPNSDFAVLRVSPILSPVLQLSTAELTRGTSAAALGYPGGGNLTISPAVILNQRIALGRNIYNQSVTSRQIYEINADIEPGNSGGPLALADGTVAGVVFAKSVGQDGYGYVLTADEIRAQLQQATANSRRVVTTGACTSE